MDEKKKQEQEAAIRRFFRKAIHGDDILWAAEIAANFGMCSILGMLLVILLLGVILSATGFLYISSSSFFWYAMINMVQMIACVAVCISYKGSRRWIKNLLLLSIMVVILGADMLLGFRVIILTALPVLVSTRYMNKEFTGGIAVVSALFIVAGTVGYSYFGISPDLNFTILKEGTQLLSAGGLLRNTITAADVIDVRATAVNLLLRDMLPELFMFSVIGIACVRLADMGYKTLLEQRKISNEYSRIDTELNTATDIQANMLPSIFPAFPEHREFDIYATMTPAREVGGDFYDFFMVDDHTLAFVIADVSGKGVPAALFMVIAKTLIKDHAQMGESPRQVFENVNNLLCEGNEADLFVTAWLGYLDLETGDVTYVNAGHNPPLLLREGEAPAAVKAPVDLVLAGMEEFEYHEQHLTIAPGDRLFLYTDGITEATDTADDFYGEERLSDFFEHNQTSDQKVLLEALHTSIKDFSKGAPQFDDITMLVLDLNELQETEAESGSEKKESSITVKAQLNFLEKVKLFLEDWMEFEDVPMDIQHRTQLAAEEVFVNIASYAYPETPGEVTVRVCLEETGDERNMHLTFMDRGNPFDPLETGLPSEELLEDEDKMGGFGIFLVKEIMNRVDYRYENGNNVLELVCSVDE